jgi:2-polyprenyl-3-methyl-5-hydroxy-6-metoxy-1,4-benzoquinol methylase
MRRSLGGLRRSFHCPTSRPSAGVPPLILPLPATATEHTGSIRHQLPSRPSYTRRMTTDTASTAPTSAASSTTTATHYQQHAKADSYEQAYFYEPGAYTDWLKHAVMESLELGPVAAKWSNSSSNRCRLLDVGGGTGNFTQLLLESNACLEAVVVDPFLTKEDATDDCNHGSKMSPLRFVSAPAEAFCQESDSDSPWWRQADTYDRVLLKEVVHHLQDRVALFRGIGQTLRAPTRTSAAAAPPPQLLIVTRPQHEIDYPLWPAACDVWAAHQPSVDVLVRELEQAGFTKVVTQTQAYPCQISLARWQAMVTQRCWSTFGHFSDAQLGEATQQTIPTLHAHRLDATGTLHFEDRLVLIQAWK